MLGRVVLVIGAWFAAGALLMLEQRRRAPSGPRTGWRKYAVYLGVVMGLLALADAGPVWFAAVMAGILIAALSEFYRAAPVPRAAALPLVLAGAGIGAMGLAAGPAALCGAAVALCMVTFAAGALARQPQRGAVSAVWAAAGLLAVAAPGAHLLLLAREADRFALFAFLFAVIAGGDACAELIGRRWPVGRGIVPVSPAKTASGVAGGVVGAAAVGLTLAFLVPTWSLPRVAATALLLALAGGIGDLVASSMKRAFGIKDFGAWLPGQGGALDRFDSLLFAAAPFYWLTRGL